MPSKILLGAFALLLAASFTASAQTYRWTDTEGRVHYTDTPPPKDAVKAQEKQLRGNTASGGDVPYSMQEAMKNFPVRLFTRDNCAPCVDGRAFLNKRGIPFREIVVKDEASLAEIKKVDANPELPMLVIGADVRKGYEAGMWNSALDTAGYPRIAIPAGKASTPVSPPTPH